MLDETRLDIVDNLANIFVRELPLIIDALRADTVELACAAEVVESATHVLVAALDNRHSVGIDSRH